jgi:hypothetical protein
VTTAAKIVLIFTAICGPCLAQQAEVSAPVKKERLQKAATAADQEYDKARKNIEKNLFSLSEEQVQETIKKIKTTLTKKAEARISLYTELTNEMETERSRLSHLGASYSPEALRTERQVLTSQIKSLQDEENDNDTKIKAYRATASTVESEKAILELEERTSQARSLVDLLRKQEDAITDVLLSPDHLSNFRQEMDGIYKGRMEIYQKEVAETEKDKNALMEYYGHLSAAAKQNAVVKAAGAGNTANDTNTAGGGKSDSAGPPATRPPNVEGRNALPVLCQECRLINELPQGRWELEGKSRDVYSAVLELLGRQGNKLTVKLDRGSSPLIGYIALDSPQVVRINSENWNFIIRGMHKDVVQFDLYKPSGESPFVRFPLKKRGLFGLGQ